MTLDRLTILMPVTHYHQGYLQQAIESVFHQTRPEWRLLIVVDEGRRSHFQSLLSAPLADERVSLISNQGRLLAGAYNSAMRVAETEFIGVLLGDDLWEPEAVDVLRQNILANPHVDFFHTGRRFISGDGGRLSSDYLPDTTVTDESFRRGSPVKHLLCWRVRMGLACGGVDETLNNFGSDDYDFPWTMLTHGAAFQGIPRALYAFRDHRDGYRLTTHVPRSVQRRELRRILEKHRVPPTLIRRRIREANRHYLRQGLFANHLHRWVLERLGFQPEHGWREPYL